MTLMLWYKAWHEMRLKFLLCSVAILFLVYMTLMNPHLESSQKVIQAAQSAGFQATEWVRYRWWQVYKMVCFVWAIYAPMLAGAGINSQTGFGMTRGIHGSMLFTLSLPIRRRTILLNRASLGVAAGLLLALSPAILIPLLSGWIYPTASFSFSDALCYSLFAYAGGLILYCVSVLFATFLDEQWQLYATWAVLGAVITVDKIFTLSWLKRFFEFVTSQTYLQTHSMPWGMLAICLAISATLLAAAIRVAERREY